MIEADAAQACAFCDAQTPLGPLDLPGLSYRVCARCADDLAAQGRRPAAPFEPHLARVAAHAWRMPLEPDATWLAARLLATEAPRSATWPPLAAWTRATASPSLDALRAGLSLDGPPAGRPPAGDVVYALAAAVVAGEELGPWDRVERIAPTSSPLGELLLGVYAHHAARVRLARLEASGELAPPTWSEPEQRQAGGDLLLRAPRYAAVAGKLDPVLPRVLDAARQAYQYSDALTQPAAKRSADGGLGHRVALLSAALSIERGDGDEAKGSRDERSLDRAARLVKEHEEAVGQKKISPDPRAALLEAAVQRMQGFKDGCDRALLRGVQQAGADPQWRGVLHQLQHDRYVRALDSASWTVATDALRACRALRPDDRVGRLELAYLYYRRSMPAVAREVLEATLRVPPDEQTLGRDAREWLGAARDEVSGSEPEVRLLLAACSARLGDPQAALDLLRPGLDEDAPAPAEHWHLAGLCEHELGRTERALALLGQAVKLGDGRPGAFTRRRDLVRVVLVELRERLLELEARVAPLREELSELDRASRVADPAEREPLVARLALEVLGDPEPGDSGADESLRRTDTLPGLVALAARDGAAVVEELDQVGATWGSRETPITLTSADLLGMFLLCELADPELRGQLSRAPIFSDLLDVSFGFSRYDRATGSGSMMNAFLVYRALVARRLPEAVRTNRLVVEAPVPIDLLLRLLAVVRTSDDARRALLGVVLGLLLPRLERRGLVVRAGGGPQG